MNNSKALLIGGLIAIAGAGAYAVFHEEDSVGDNIDEGIEEVQDEVDDAH